MLSYCLFFHSSISVIVPCTQVYASAGTVLSSFALYSTFAVEPSSLTQSYISVVGETLFTPAPEVRGKRCLTMRDNSFIYLTWGTVVESSYHRIRTWMQCH